MDDKKRGKGPSTTSFLSPQRLSHHRGNTVTLLILALALTLTLAVSHTNAYHFRIVTIREAPFGFVNDNPDTGEEEYTGYIVQFADQLFERLFPGNWSYTMYEVPDGNYGTKNEDGTWNGLLGEILEDRADLALAPLTITSSRLAAVDFSVSFLDMGFTIMVRKAESTDIFGFLRPFTWDLWLTLIIINFAVGLAIFILDRITPYGYSKKPETKTKLNISKSVLNSTMTLFGRASDPGKSWSTRVLMLGYFFVMMIALSSYTANLAAFLAVQRMDVDVSSLNDIRLRGLSFCTMHDSATADYFLQSPLASDMRRYMVLKPTFEECVIALRNFEVDAAIADSPVIEYIVNREPCDTLQVGQQFNRANFGIAFPKGYPMIGRFNEKIFAMREDGALDILYKRWWYDLGSCDLDTSSLESSSLSTANFAGVFIIFGGFAVVTLLMIILENIIYYGKKAVYERMAKATQHNNHVVTPNEEDQYQEKEGVELEMEMELRKLEQQQVQSLDAASHQSQDHETKGEEEKEETNVEIPELE